MDAIFSAVLCEAGTLAMDPFGNYLIQKLLQYGTSEQRDTLIEGTQGQIIEIALNVHGTRVVQKMIECNDSERQVTAICGAIQPRIMELIQDMNGNHVIQRCLASLPADRSSFIFTTVVKECLAVSCHRHGCCVLQRCLDHADAQHRSPIVTPAASFEFGARPATSPRDGTATWPLMARPRP